jgi:hypothetical protein
MKPQMHQYIRQWRANNPVKYHASIQRAAQKRLAWQSISTEFRRILIAEHLPDFKETRGRKKKTPLVKEINLIKE